MNGSDVITEPRGDFEPEAATGPVRRRILRLVRIHVYLLFPLSWSNMATDLDSFLRNLGNPGRYQCFVCVLLLVNIMALSFHNLNMVFMGATPPHRCKIPPDQSLNDSIPWKIEHGEQKFDKCLVFVDPSNHSLGTEPCPNGWDYFYEGTEWTIVGEWDLVCNRKYLVGLATTCYFGGTLIGSPLLGILGDKIGRKPVFLGTLFAHIAVGIIQFFAANFQMFAFFKFVHGMLMQGMINACHNLTMEQFRKVHRAEASIGGSLCWTTGQFILAFMAYMCPNWRYLYLLNTLPSLLTISYIWLVPESLRWLLVNNRVPEAIKVARLYVRRNNIQVKDNFDQELEDLAQSLRQSEGKQRKFDVRDLFRTRYIRRLSFAMAYIWFAASLVYYGINFSLPRLGGNKYINFSISAAVEMASRLPLYFILKKLGRRIPTFVSFILSGILCITSVLIGEYASSSSFDVKLVAIALAFIGKATCSISFASIILLTSEVFPTVIRGAASGICGLTSRIGGMSAPQILLLGDYTAKIVPLSFFGLASIVAGLATLSAPETKNSALPDTIEETEAICSKAKNKRKQKKAKAAEAADDSKHQVTALALNGKKEEGSGRRNSAPGIKNGTPNDAFIPD